MLTYTLKKAPGVPLYEALYRAIRQDIAEGRLPAGTKLPSQRALAANLKVSKITVEAAYDHLSQEGYIRSYPKRGFFVEQTELCRPRPRQPEGMPAEAPETLSFDLTGSAPGDFPFTVWSRLERQVMLDVGTALLKPLPNQGAPELRRAIADHLFQFRGFRADPENILVGAGTDFLYTLLVQILGRDKTYFVEEPGYGKIRSIYASTGARCMGVPLDDFGVSPESLMGADVLHISPSHHFPTGIVTPLPRRLELLQWAKTGGHYIIEDDYDSEFGFRSHPMPALAALDDGGRVIYMNTFSRSLAPALRVGYMVLPEDLMAKFRENLGFYGCTVSSFEQYTLARFLSEGYFEKHINRMRKSYRTRRTEIRDILENCPGRFSILEQEAGVHFLLRLETPLSDEEIVKIWAEQGIRVRPLSGFYHGEVPEKAAHCLVISYASLPGDRLEALAEALSKSFKRIWEKSGKIM